MHVGEVISQSFDILAFVMVTPELLGEDKLKAIHIVMEKVSHYAKSIFVNETGRTKLENIKETAQGYLGILMFAALAGALWQIHMKILQATPEPYYLIVELLIWFVLIGLGLMVSIVAFFTVLLVFSSVVAFVAVRRVMFSLGVLLFIAARAISIWGAWHS